VSDRYQLQLSIAYSEAVTVHALQRPTAHYLCRVTAANTSLSRSEESKHAAEAEHAHTFQRYPDHITSLLVARSSQSYSGGRRALFLAELHSRFHEHERGGGSRPSCGG
jgi:hypothetical protein